MQSETVAQLVEQLHCPEAAERVGNVFIVFGDGEVCLTKSGPLFMRRILHRWRPGASRVVKMPIPFGQHSYAIMDSEEDALRLHRAIIVG